MYLKAQFYGPHFFLFLLATFPLTLDVTLRSSLVLLFLLVRDSIESLTKFGRDLGRVARWEHQQKISFNTDTSQPVVEVHFSRKISPVDTAPFYFNNLAVASCKTHKHLGLLLDKGLAFNRPVEKIILIVNQGVGLITRFCRYLPTNSL